MWPWQTGVLFDHQQEPPQIVWESVCLFKLTVYYIYRSVYIEYICKHNYHALSCLDNCLWAPSLPIPVLLSTAMSASQCANLFRAAKWRQFVICLSAVLILPPRCWKILLPWRQGGVTLGTGSLFQSDRGNNKHHQLCAKSKSVDLNCSFQNGMLYSGKKDIILQTNSSNFIWLNLVYRWLTLYLLS